MARLRESEEFVKNGRLISSNRGTTYVEAENQLQYGFAKAILDEGPTRFTPGIFSINPVRQWIKTCHTTELPKQTWDLFTWVSTKLGTYRWDTVGSLEGSPLRPYVNYRNYDGYTPEYTELADMVRVSAAAKANSPEADVTMMLAESSETIMLMSNALKLVANPWKVLHKLPSQIKTYKRKLSYLSDKWLEYRYGIMPTFMDIQDLQSTYENDIVRPADQIRKSSAIARQPRKVILDEVAGYSHSAHMWGIKWRYTVFREYTVTSHVYYKVRDTNMSTNVGGGIYNLFPLAWELVPYSFVVDWFINVGDFLRASYPRPDHIELGNSVGFKTRIVATAVLTDYFAITGGTGWRLTKPLPLTCNTIDTWEAYTRVKKYPLPAFPQVNYAFSNVKHAFDSAALGWGNLAKHLPKR